MYSKSVKRTLTISVLLLFLGGCKATFVETYNNGTPYKAMARAVGDAVQFEDFKSPFAL